MWSASVGELAGRGRWRIFWSRQWYRSCLDHVDITV